MFSPVYSKHSLMVLALAALAWSFWWSSGWLQLCAGLALFLFGMQSLEQGLKNLAGGRLEQWLGKSTSTPFKGLLFGSVASLLLQSSTLVSLLTIAFLSAGLITLVPTWVPPAVSGCWHWQGRTSACPKWPCRCWCLAFCWACRATGARP